MVKTDNRGKRGVSPVIATVLLIGMVIVIALIIFLWVRNMSGESITKFGDESIQYACDDVEFDSSYFLGILNIVNNGVVPIFGMKIKTFQEGSYDTKSLSDESSWPDFGLTQGGTFSDSVVLGPTDKIVLIPVLMGNSKDGKKTFMCDEEQHGFEISI